MTQKYITKLLPVEGTPQKGDIVMGLNGVCAVWGNKSRHGLSILDDTTFGYLTNPRKAKMFLCTNEFEAGEEVWQPFNNYVKPMKVESIFNKDSIYFTDKPAIGTDRQNCFVIVAEISHKAMWVKDCQEMWEENIMKRFIPIEDNCDSGSMRGYEEGLKYLDMTKWKAFAWIKCPSCETFH